LKLSNSALKLTGDLVRVPIRCETHRSANRDPHVAGPREDLLALFQVKKPMQVDWNDGDVQLFREQADAGPERHHVSVVGRSAFRENQNIPAAVGKVAREGEAPEKT